MHYRVTVTKVVNLSWKQSLRNFQSVHKCPRSSNAVHCYGVVQAEGVSRAKGTEAEGEDGYASKVLHSQSNNPVPSCVVVHHNPESGEGDGEVDTEGQESDGREAVHRRQEGEEGPNGRNAPNSKHVHFEQLIVHLCSSSVGHEEVV